MNELVLASNNAKKIAEIQKLLPSFRLRSLSEIGFTQEIPEPYNSFEENAFTKADTIHRISQLPVLSDDSGLMVDALDGAPGVLSARYAGEPSNDANNNQKLLAALAGTGNRNARFVCVICLIIDGKVEYFKGVCEGSIVTEPRGDKGFGYDPLFVPAGYDRTMAELSVEEKGQVSHRGKALKALHAYIVANYS